MKIVDFDVADVIFGLQNNPNQSTDIAKLKHNQKYVLLEAGNEIFELEISDVTDTAFYLKIKDDNNGPGKENK